MLRSLALLLFLLPPVFAEPDPEPVWEATPAAVAVETADALAFRRTFAYIAGTGILLLLGALFWLYGRWYRRKTMVLARRTPLLNGPGHASRWPPTPAA